MGTNKGASQAGQSFGKPRYIIDWDQWSIFLYAQLEEYKNILVQRQSDVGRLHLQLPNKSLSMDMQKRFDVSMNAYYSNCKS